LDSFKQIEASLKKLEASLLQQKPTTDLLPEKYTEGGSTVLLQSGQKNKPLSIEINEVTTIGEDPESTGS
jgi:hypothetical protein